MRRNFRVDLLIDQPPMKTMKHPKRKYVSRKNVAFGELMTELINEAGEKYCKKDLAKRAVVQVQTVNKWANGHQAGKYSLWPIAAYFGGILKRSEKELYKNLCSICEDFSK